MFHFKGGLFACIKSCLTLLYIHCLWTPRGIIRSPLWSCSKFLPTRFYHEEDPWSRHLVDEWVSKQCDRPDTQITVCNSAEYQSRKMQHALFDVVHTSSWSWPNTTRGWWVIFVTCGMRCLWRSAWNLITGYLWSEDDESFWIDHELFFSSTTIKGPVSRF